MQSFCLSDGSCKMKKLVVNGKFLSQRTTGVQRFAREVVSRLDPLVKDLDVELVMASDARDVPEFKNIKVKTLPGKASVFWEQIKLPLYLVRKKALGLHLCNVAPFLKPDIAVVHDANVERNPHWFTWKLVLWYSFLHRACALRAKKILTVSEFSKKELQDVFRIPDEKIANVGEGWQHIERIGFDEKALQKYGLESKGFYFSLGTLALHKNLKWICEYARMHPEENFALSGSCYKKVFGNAVLDFPENVHFLGYLSDEEIKTLMRDCKAFLFPSFYEGFGLPPLEALSLGTKIIVSDIPVMHEIFGDSAHYIDPAAPAGADLNQLLETPAEEPFSALERYTWQRVTVKVWYFFSGLIE